MDTNLSLYFPLWAFIAFMVMTPGPANLLVMSSGLQNGVKATMPFLVGSMAGMLILNASMAAGIGALLHTYPTFSSILTSVSVAYMIYLSSKSWSLDESKDSNERKTLSFYEGFWVHPLSPKAWLMVTIAYSQFATNLGSTLDIFIVVAASFAFCQLLFQGSWCIAGSLLQKSIGQSILLNRCLIILTISVVIWAAFQK